MTVNKSVHRLSTVVLSVMRELDVIWSVIKYRCQKPRIIWGMADIALFEQVAGKKKKMLSHCFKNLFSHFQSLNLFDRDEVKKSN